MRIDNHFNSLGRPFFLENKKTMEKMFSEIAANPSQIKSICDDYGRSDLSLLKLFKLYKDTGANESDFKSILIHLTINTKSDCLNLLEFFKNNNFDIEDLIRHFNPRFFNSDQSDSNVIDALQILNGHEKFGFLFEFSVRAKHSFPPLSPSLSNGIYSFDHHSNSMQYSIRDKSTSSTCINQETKDTVNKRNDYRKEILGKFMIQNSGCHYDDLPQVIKSKVSIDDLKLFRLKVPKIIISKSSVEVEFIILKVSNRQLDKRSPLHFLGL